MIVEEVSAIVEPDELIALVKAYLAALDDHGRMEFIANCMEDYCEFCGSNHLPCYCMNDD